MHFFHTVHNSSGRRGRAESKRASRSKQKHKYVTTRSAQKQSNHKLASKHAKVTTSLHTQTLFDINLNTTQEMPKNSKSESPFSSENAPVQAPNENEVYRPSLVHLRCRGALRLTSTKHDVICDGISSHLETIREYPPMKPHAALHTFKNQTSFYHPPGGDSDDSYQASFGGEMEESGNTSGRRIRNHKTHAVPRKDKKIDLPVVVDTKWTEMKDNLQEQTGVDLTKLDTTHSEMTLYGTSSAYFLVLRPYSEINKAIAESMKDETIQTDEESKENENLHEIKGILGQVQDDLLPIPPKSHIYAVNPVNELGVAKRKVSSKENGLACTSTTVKLGILEIHMASLEKVTEVGPEEVKSRPNSVDDSSPSSNRARPNSEIDKGSKPMVEEEEESSSSIKLPLPSLQQMQKFLKKVDHASEKIQNQMYQNANLVKNELENDFVNRTFRASQKVAGSFEKNLVRMKKTLEDTIKFLSDVGKD